MIFALLFLEKYLKIRTTLHCLPLTYLLLPTKQVLNVVMPVSAGSQNASGDGSSFAVHMPAKGTMMVPTESNLPAGLGSSMQTSQGNNISRRDSKNNDTSISNNIADSNRLPGWLKTAKEALTSSRQWTLLVKDIHEKVSEELAKQKIKFSDLNPTEQQALVEQMHARLYRDAHDSVGNFERAVGSVVDTEVAAEVRRTATAVENDANGSGSDGNGNGKGVSGTMRNKDRSSASTEGDSANTSAAKIIDVATSAIISLLEQLPPEHRALTRLMLGNPFPESFRHRAWALSTKNATARKEYEAALARRRVDTISTMDVQITQGACVGIYWWHYKKEESS